MIRCMKSCVKRRKGVTFVVFEEEREEKNAQQHAACPADKHSEKGNGPKIEKDGDDVRWTPY